MSHLRVDGALAGPKCYSVELHRLSEVMQMVGEPWQISAEGVHPEYVRVVWGGSRRQPDVNVELDRLIGEHLHKLVSGASL